MQKYLCHNLLKLIFLVILYFGASELKAQKDTVSLNYGFSQQLQDKKNYLQLLENYDVKFYFLDIQASNSSDAIVGKTEILATSVIDSLSEFVFELHSEISIDSILIFDRIQNYVRSDYWVDVKLDSFLTANKKFTVKIYYNRSGNLNIYGVYHYKSLSENLESTATISQPFYARNWFPCKQNLKDKADSVWVFITVPKNLKAGSNGKLTAVTPIGTNKLRYEWKSNYPIAYYLISFSVADYVSYDIYAKPKAMKGDSILIQNFLPVNYEKNNEFISSFNYSAKMLELFSDKYSLYPFWKEKYGHCVAHGFEFGALEHQTMTTTSSPELFVIAHELGHQWFGNYVTCASWQDIWINEGFASYSEHIAFQYIFGKDSAANWLETTRYWALLATSGSVYVPLDEIANYDRVFDWSLTYRKGMCLVHMIRNEINNDDQFFRLLRGFLALKANGVATGDDFKNYLNQNSKVNFNSFFDEWYYGEGYPIYKIIWKYEGKKMRFIIKQNTTSKIIPYFTNTLPIKITTDKTEKTVRIKPKQLIDTIYIKIKKNQKIKSIELDPDNWILYGEESTIKKETDN